MNEQDLLSQLLLMLDTLEQPGEIANTVRKIREIKGPKAFSSAPTNQSMVSLSHPDRMIELRVRGLGLMLRGFSHQDPKIARLMQDMEAALQTPDASVPREDLIALLAIARDLIALGQEQGRLNAAGPMMSSRRVVAEDLHASMQAMFVSMNWGGRRF